MDQEVQKIEIKEFDYGEIVDDDNETNCDDDDDTTKVRQILEQKELKRKKTKKKKKDDESIGCCRFLFNYGKLCTLMIVLSSFQGGFWFSLIGTLLLMGLYPKKFKKYLKPLQERMGKLLIMFVFICIFSMIVGVSYKLWVEGINPEYDMQTENQKLNNELPNPFKHKPLEHKKSQLDKEMMNEIMDPEMKLKKKGEKVKKGKNDQEKNKKTNTEDGVFASS